MRTDPLKLERIPYWKLNLMSLFLLLDTVLRACWRRREGPIGILLYPWEIAKNILLYLTALIFIGRKTGIGFSLYAWLRRLDDVVDGDALPPEGKTTEEYIKVKWDLLDWVTGCSLDWGGEIFREDLLLIYFMRGAQESGISCEEEIRNLWETIFWDKERREKLAISSKETLFHYAKLQDDSFLRIAAKVCGGDVGKLNGILQGIPGLITRTDWFYDFPKDIEKGMINIPAEVIEAYGISEADLRSGYCWEIIRQKPGVLDWYRNEGKLLKEEWKSAKIAVGPNLGGIFSRKVINRLVYKTVCCMADRLLNKRSSLFNEP